MESSHYTGGRGTIRAAATSLFAEKGYAATSTREICQQAGVTKPVLYYHFGNKEGLYRELILDAFHEYLRELERVGSVQGNVRERFIRVVTTVFDFCRRRPDLVRLVFRMAFAPEKESPVIDYIALAEADERLLTHIAAEAKANGQIVREPLEVANGLSGVSRFYLMSHLVTGQPSLDESLATRIVDLILQGCGSPPTDR